MASTVNAGPRLDRLPISSFHYRIFWLIGAGMFFDGYDLYVGASVLGSAVQTKFAVLAQVPQFISWTFVGMTIGAVIAGFLGDKYGRRLMQEIEREASDGQPLPPPAPAAPVVEYTFASLFSPALLPRMIVGSVVLIAINTLIFGFVNWLPTFFGQQGIGIAKSLTYTMVLAGGSLVGCAIGAWCADAFGRKPTIIGASLLSIAAGWVYPYMVDPTMLLSVGFVLIVGIYILTAVLYGVYTTELFPTEVRLRANGLCNMLGRGATVVSPFIVLALFKSYGVQGVLALMIGLLIVQIIVVAIWGIETNKRGLEELEGSKA